MITMRPFACILLILSLTLGAHAADPPRAARSVHLGYPGPDGELFYTEMVIEQSVNGSYFMACGWNTGYFGLQQLGNPTNKVVIFSVWDPTKGNDANAVSPEDRVELPFQGDGVRIRRFGGEGTGGQCMAPFDWKIGQTNRFLLRGEPQGNKTAYTAWIYRPEEKKWWQLATFRTRTGGLPLRGYYSFVEDFRRDTKSVGETRRARYGNGWVKPVEQAWQSLNQARFTASGAEWESKDNIDAGQNDNWFYLATGGDIHTNTALRATIQIAAATQAPPKDLPVQTATPLVNIVAQTADGLISMHASNAVVHGSVLRYEPATNKMCLGYWTRPEDWAEFSFEIKQPGEFTLEVWQGCGKDQGGSDVVVEAGEQKFPFIVEDTGGFQNFKARRLGTVTLAAGRHTITVKPQNKKKAAVMDVRWVKLIPAEKP